MAANARADGAEELIDTIFALSSGSPPAAIAVVRISGPQAGKALDSLSEVRPVPRRAALTSLRQGDEIIDNALVLWFPGPRTATGEDLAELHLHGGRAVVTRTLAALDAMPGLRPAQPGEFTRRAFENGRIDLAEAEGLADLLAAETESQRRAAFALAGGALSRQVARWEEILLGLAARVEAELDFSDEGDVGEASGDIAAGIAALAGELENWLARPRAERLRDGVRVAIAGPPNAGKSTLINALAQREAAITSALAGTTRDLIEVPVAIGGIPYLLIDTAGLRSTAEEIEAIGIARAEEAIATADIILWLGAPDQPPPGEVIKVQSKADLGRQAGSYDVRLSALSGQGLDRLVARLAESAARLLPGEGEVALHQRHRLELAEALGWLREAAGAGDSLIQAEGLRQARAALDRVTGRAGVEAMLDALFGRFCIGK